MKSILAIALILFTVNEVFAASLVEYSGNPTVITASGQDVKVAPEAKLTLPDDGVVSLKLSGAGIRKKKVAFVSVNVYVAASYVADPAALKGTQPLEGIKTSKGRIIKLTLLRALSGEEIANSFREALEANSVDVNETAIANVFAKMTFNVKAGETVTLIGFEKKEGGLEKFVIELPQDKKIEEEGKDLSLSFWTVFFGKPVDDGMAALKAALIGN